MKRKHETPEYRKKKQKKQIISFVFFVLLLSAFVYVMNLPYLRIDTVSIEGNTTLETEDIQNEVDSYLNEKWVFLIPKRNFLFVIPSQLEQRLKTSFSKIYDLNINPDLNTLHIFVTERTPHSLWCEDREYSSRFNERCFFSDQRGFLYTKAPYFSDNVFMKFFTSQTLRTGKRYFSYEEFIAFDTFLENMASREVDIQKIVFLDHGDIEVHVDSLLGKKLSQEPVILMNLEVSYQQTLRNLEVVLGEPEFQQQFTSEEFRLGSIDLRFQDRVFYQFDE